MGTSGIDLGDLTLYNASMIWSRVYWSIGFSHSIPSTSATNVGCRGLMMSLVEVGILVRG